jgi:hypothetical protein
VTTDVHVRPVVEPGTAQGTVVDAEAEAADEVKRRPGGSAEARDVAGVWRNLGFPERDV